MRKQNNYPSVWRLNVKNRYGVSYSNLMCVGLIEVAKNIMKSCNAQKYRKRHNEMMCNEVNGFFIQGKMIPIVGQ